MDTFPSYPSIGINKGTAINTKNFPHNDLSKLGFITKKKSLAKTELLGINFGS